MAPKLKLVSGTSTSDTTRPPRPRRARKPPIAHPRSTGRKHSPPLYPADEGSPLFEPTSDTEPAQPLEETSTHPNDSGGRPANLDRPPSVKSAPMSGGNPLETGTAFSHSANNHNNPSELPEIKQPQPRYMYRDFKGVLREIWQPGDGDGVPNGEFPGALSFVERFRFFQSDIGPVVRGSNSPPKFVILDDKACHDIWIHNLYKIKDRARFWCHDFSVNGNVRHGRANRGRAVLLSAEDGGETIDRKDSRGPIEVGWAFTGDTKKGKKYLFSGERHGYKAVNFGTNIAHTVSQTESQEQPQPDAKFESGQQQEVEAVQSANAKGKRKALSTGARKQNNMPSAPSPEYKRTRRHAYLPATVGSVSATATRPAVQPASKNDDMSTSTSLPRRSYAKKPSARAVYAGMPYNHQEDYNPPAVLGGNPYAARGAGNEMSHLRSPMPADNYEQEVGAEYDEEYNGEYDEEYNGEYDEEYSGEYDEEYSGEYDEEYNGEYYEEEAGAAYDEEYNGEYNEETSGGRMQQVGGSSYKLESQLPIWTSVKVMEDALHDAKRRLASKDYEIAGLRREVARLRDKYVERLRVKDEPETIYLTSGQSRVTMMED